MMKPVLHLFIVLVSLWPGCGLAAVTYQDIISGTATSATSVATSTGANLAVGQLNACLLEWELSSISASSVTDTAGNTYLLTTKVSNPNVAMTRAVAYTVATAANASNVVTLTLDSSASHLRVDCLRFTSNTGFPASASVLSQTAANAANAANGNSGNITTSAQTVNITGIMRWNGAVFTPPSGYTELIDVNWYWGTGVAYDVDVAAGTYDTVWTSSSDNFVVGVAAFIEQAAGGSPTLGLLGVGK